MTYTSIEDALAETEASMGVPYATFVRPHRDGKKTITVAAERDGRGSTQQKAVVREDGEEISRHSDHSKGIAAALNRAGWVQVKVVGL